jgi:hypothetical protein
MPIKGSHAFVLLSLRNITVGEPLTVRYTAEGYHERDSICRCASCNPRNPPVAPRHEIDNLKFKVTAGKRIHRGGRRAKAKKRMVQEAAGSIDM